MRLIDADGFIEKFAMSPLVQEALRKALNHMPTVDAIEVVRCKDCKFFEDEDYYGNCYCEEWGNITNANGYCHDAERRKKR